MQLNTQSTAACAIKAQTSLNAPSATACIHDATQVQTSSINAWHAANRYPAIVITHR